MRKLKLEELNRPELDDYKAMSKNPVTIVLDNIRSMHNVGSTFRTADAFLIEKIWLCGITGTPPNREINKTALGATESVDWEYSENACTLVDSLKNNGYTIISLEQTDGSVMMQDFQPEKDKKYCFVFGNEVFGVDDKIIENSDLCLEIPQFGTKHSLNVSVSVGITLWDYMLKMNKF